MKTDTPETDAHQSAMEVESFSVELAETYTLARKLERERNAAIEALENHKALAIHTCSQYCQRPLCVAHRQIAAMREAIKEAHDALTALDQCRIFYADSMDIDNHTTDACATARAKLQPLLKP